MLALARDAISVLSAVEGLTIVDARLEPLVLPTAAAILAVEPLRSRWPGQQRNPDAESRVTRSIKRRNGFSFRD